MSVQRCLMYFILLSAFGWGAKAQDAMVEDASAGAPVTPFTFLTAGEAFQLAPAQSARIGYLSSCISEEISGGTAGVSVEIGTRQSRITGGSVHRETIACDIDVQLATAERNESGASAWRNDPSDGVTIIANLSPLLIFPSAPPAIRIERTDIPQRPIRLAANTNAIDLHERGVRLEAGGIYVITAGADQREIEVAFTAVNVGGPAFLRAIRF
ncbi:MAG: hypothetical protein ACPG4X_12855 [Pikeienuella sp.]